MKPEPVNPNLNLNINLNLNLNLILLRLVLPTRATLLNISDRAASSQPLTNQLNLAFTRLEAFSAFQESTFPTLLR